jgi:hypothetical protein
MPSIVYVQRSHSTRIFRPAKFGNHQKRPMLIGLKSLMRYGAPDRRR